MTFEIDEKKQIVIDDSRNAELTYARITQGWVGYFIIRWGESSFHFSGRYAIEDCTSDKPVIAWVIDRLGRDALGIEDSDYKNLTFEQISDLKTLICDALSKYGLSLNGDDATYKFSFESS